MRKAREEQMDSVGTLELIRHTGVIAIVREARAQAIVNIAQSLYDGGIRAVEVAIGRSFELEMVRQLCKTCPKDMLIGAGTVLDAETARASILAGATFVLSPSLSPQVVSLCNRYSILAVPGVLTPTEAVEAWEIGARAVKIFPAGVVGPGYIRDLRGPLPQIEMIPVGGVNVDNTAEFIRAGACAVGVGGGLVDRAAVASGDWAELTCRATKLLAEVRKARAQK